MDPYRTPPTPPEEPASSDDTPTALLFLGVVLWVVVSVWGAGAPPLDVDDGPGLSHYVSTFHGAGTRR